MGDFELWRKTFPEVSGAVMRMRNKSFSDGAIPAKYKVLMALLVSVMEKCKPCAQSYYRKALELGATDEEIKEVFEVAITMGACISETWAREVWKYGRNIENQGESCCK
ncbi:carboxymuconolactone decarboxylase family protein [Thermotoga sp. KOL6]|uniref:carboxymuconolactone decarboxylase family protein n=1 Tax=Thermotoga sp. KOL6 TaxID=126741 RepID=UPI000C7654A1|nr:carboxymuconolactone decarboxylase family protein [Thermotoga sp. KOL6]PLV59501.1 alkylhydroperoxidase [Thermotoga sp. KOL6]